MWDGAKRLGLLGYLVKKFVDDFGRNSASAGRFYALAPSSLSQWVAKDARSRCVLACIVLRLGVFRGSFRHVPWRETCLTARRKVECGGLKVELWM